MIFARWPQGRKLSEPIVVVAAMHPLNHWRGEETNGAIAGALSYFTVNTASGIIGA
jgi:hypothetical protein